MITSQDILNPNTSYVLKVKENNVWRYFVWRDDYIWWQTVKDIEDADKMGLRLAMMAEDMVKKQNQECEIEPVKWEEKK